ncbi:hypothetical protein R3P38DRAFT_2801757 [Favolaschia claudopus]
MYVTKGAYSKAREEVGRGTNTGEDAGERRQRRNERKSSRQKGGVGCTASEWGSDARRTREVGRTRCGWASSKRAKALTGGNQTRNCAGGRQRCRTGGVNEGWGAETNARGVASASGKRINEAGSASAKQTRAAARMKVGGGANGWLRNEGGRRGERGAGRRSKRTHGGGRWRQENAGGVEWRELGSEGGVDVHTNARRREGGALERACVVDMVPGKQVSGWVAASEGGRTSRASGWGPRARGRTSKERVGAYKRASGWGQGSERADRANEVAAPGKREACVRRQRQKERLPGERAGCWGRGEG